MADVTVYGSPISTFANIVRVVLTEKRVASDFRCIEPNVAARPMQLTASTAGYKAGYIDFKRS